MADTPPNGASNFGRMLVRLLANRIRIGSDSPILPLVVENRLPQMRTVQLLVVWDAWRDLPGPERSRIITDAYLSATPARLALPVAVPLGLTAAEALSLGYLPYRIVPTVRKQDRVSDRNILDAMKAAGGVFTQIGSETQLRFATLGQAQEAYRSLQAKVPGPFWTLVQEQPTVEMA